MSKILIFDVDGVLTTGQFIYSSEGKTYKIFGPHDSDGLKLLSDKTKIKFITADKRGFQISRKRIVEDMGYELDLVSEQSRLDYLSNNYDLSKIVYMGDGYFDAPILEKCFYGIAPANARIEARNSANYVTPSRSGEGAVLDACLHIIEKKIIPIDK